MMNKAEKTKAAIAQSLVEMLQRKPLDLITVSDLTANAGVCKFWFVGTCLPLKPVHLC